MNKLKIGDIIENRWAGHKMARFFIYTGSNKSGIYGLENVNGRLVKVEYGKDILKDLLDGQPGFEVVGNTKGLEVLKNDLKEFQEEYQKSKES